MIHFFRNNPVRPACFTYLYRSAWPARLETWTKRSVLWRPQA
jgi:hypothetical protein